MSRIDLLYRYSCKFTWASISAINIYSTLLSVSNGTFGSDRLDALMVLAGILSVYKLFKG